jgi:hypothetical protein
MVEEHITVAHGPEHVASSPPICGSGAKGGNLRSGRRSADGPEPGEVEGHIWYECCCRAELLQSRSSTRVMCSSTSSRTAAELGSAGAARSPSREVFGLVGSSMSASRATRNGGGRAPASGKSAPRRAAMTWFRHEGEGAGTTTKRGATAASPLPNRSSPVVGGGRAQEVQRQVRDVPEGARVDCERVSTGRCDPRTPAAARASTPRSPVDDLDARLTEAGAMSLVGRGLPGHELLTRIAAARLVETVGRS